MDFRALKLIVFGSLIALSFQFFFGSLTKRENTPNRQRCILYILYYSMFDACLALVSLFFFIRIQRIFSFFSFVQLQLVYSITYVICDIGIECLEHTQTKCTKCYLAAVRSFLFYFLFFVTFFSFLSLYVRRGSALEWALTHVHMYCVYT